MAWLALTTATAGPDGSSTDPLVLLEQCPLPVAVIDLAEGTLVRANPSFAEVFGIEGPSVGTPLRSLAPDEVDLGSVFTSLREGGIDSFEARRVLQRLDGSLLPSTSWVTILDDQQRQRALWVLVTDDVDLEPVPLPSRSRWPRAVEGVIIGVLDEGLRVAQVSQSVERSLGFARAEVIGHAATWFVHREDVPVLLGSIAHALAERGGVATQLRIRDRDNRWRRMHVTFVPLASDELQIGYTLVPVIATEPSVTARLQGLEQRLRRIAGEVEASGVPIGSGITGGDGDTGAVSAREMPQLADLTPRQWEVLDRLCRGERVPGIARRLFLSPSTVRNHLTAIYRRLGVNSQEELLEILRNPPEGPN